MELKCKIPPFRKKTHYFSDCATPLIGFLCNGMDINSGRKERGAKNCGFISAVMVSGLFRQNLVIT